MMTSPFKCSGNVTKFPKGPITDRVIIRLDETPGGRVHVSINGTPSATTGSFYLTAGETLEIRKAQAADAGDISIIDTANNPGIYWFAR